MPLKSFSTYNAAVAITQALTPSESNPSTSQKASSIRVSPSSKATLTNNYISQLKSLQELGKWESWVMKSSWNKRDLPLTVSGNSIVSNSQTSSVNIIHICIYVHACMSKYIFIVCSNHVVYTASAACALVLQLVVYLHYNVSAL